MIPAQLQTIASYLKLLIGVTTFIFAARQVVQGATPPLQALWVFPGPSAPNPVTDSTARQTLVTRSVASGIRLLYVSVYDSSPDAVRHMYGEASIADLISQAHASSIRVYAAYGAPDWPTFGCNPNGFPLQRMSDVGDYNAANPSAKFDGVILDVEPPEPQSTSDYQALLAQYDCIRATLPSDVDLSVAIRFFWDASIEYPAGSGNTKPVYAHVIDMNLKNAVVMGYRDFAGTADCAQGDSLICLDQDEIAYANAAGKSGLILVGFETSDPATTGISNKETFFEEGQTVMNDQAQLVLDHFGDKGGLGGFAIHNYQNSYLGGSSSGWPDINSSFPIATRRAKITSVRRLPAGPFRLLATGVPNRPYNLELSTELNPNSFSFLTTIFADGSGVIDYQDNTATGLTHRFYRVANP